MDAVAYADHQRHHIMKTGPGDKKLGLADAYAVETPEDNRALYRDWADTYESDFIEPRGYVYHENVAGLYARERTLDGPVLDVGCGTGTVGRALQGLGLDVIDGIDLSPEMLDQASSNGGYRTLTEVDVTQRLPIADGTYDGVVSVGAFTHGHLGPEPLAELVRIARPGALFAIGINAEHFEALGFGSFLADLADRSVITTPTFERVQIYIAADDEHADDLAQVALFRKL